MKYGLMYYKATDNLGDDIQTYAALKYLPHIDYYIDREALSTFIPMQKEQVAMIMNGWYLHNKIAWPPSPYIKPLLISMHFTDLQDLDVGDRYLKGYGGEFLKRYGPVGARDIETMKRLDRNKIPEYFSGCMTLTLEKFNNISKKNIIYLVDVDENVINKVKQSTNICIEILTHFLNQRESESNSIDVRMNNVENILRKYQEAHLVITSRLHVALPCVALGTPVILINKVIFDKDRLGSFFKYFQHYLEEDFLNMDIKSILEKPKSNSDEYIKIKEDINKKCREFIKKCEDEKYNINNSKIADLPEIEVYKDYVKKIEWYKDIYESERLSLQNLEKKRIKEYNQYHEQFKKLNDEIKNLIQLQEIMQNDLNEYKEKLQKKEEKLQLTEKELSIIYNSKGWKYLEKIRNLLNG